MSGALSEAIPLAIGVALSPLPMLALLLMLISEHETANGGAFALGWMSALAAVAGGAVIVGVSFNTSHPPAVVKTIEVAVGVILIGTGLLAWRTHRRTSAKGSHPRWLAMTDEISRRGALALGVTLVLLNVKDATLAIGAGAVISNAHLAAGQTILALAVFTLVASSTVAGPFVFAACAGDRAAPALHRVHAYLDRHGTPLGAALVGVTGVIFAIAGAA